jgi:CBS domain-containing protein
VLKAKDIMTTEVATIKASALVTEAIGLMKEKGVHALIIAPKGSEKAYGIVTEADIAYKVISKGDDPKASTVGDIMTKPCIVIKPDMNVQNVAKLFANNHIHRAPVVQDDKLEGIVSESDIISRGKWWE